MRGEDEANAEEFMGGCLRKRFQMERYNGFKTPLTLPHIMAIADQTDQLQT